MALWLPVMGVPVLPAVMAALQTTTAPVALKYGGGLVLGYSWAYSLRYTFRDTLNLVQGIGPFYYVVRDTKTKYWGIRRALMRETDYPWRRGRGIEFQVPYRTLQIGLCRRRRVQSEQDGLLDVLDGRMLDADVEEISQW